MENEHAILEERVESELAQLITLLRQKEEIKKFIDAKEQVLANESLEQLIESIRVKQKELVQFEYYEKPEATRQTKHELDQLQKELENNISLHYYQSSLRDADELLHHLFGQIQSAIDSTIE